MTDTWDCIVVGGGAAGLSAALVLGRARRRTLLVDAGEPSNRVAHGIGGLLGHDGRPPAELYALGRSELERYPTVEWRFGTVTGASRAEHIALELADGTRERTRRVLLAGGMEYRTPALPGLDALWGRSVFHCPFCHGWEVRDQPLAALGNGERGLHAGLLLRGWTDDVVLLTDGPAALDAAARERLAAAAVAIDERRVRELVAERGELTAIAFADGTTLARRGLLVGAELRQRSDLARQLGAEIGEATPLAADPVAVDAFLRTSAPGVFAAGDATGRMPQVANAVATGSAAAATIVQSLLADDYGLPGPPAVEPS